MTSFSRAAIGATFALAAASLVPAAPGFAQESPAAAQPRNYHLSPDERAALARVQVAIKAQDWAAATAALGPASAAAQGPDAKYVLGQLELQIGIGTNDEKVQANAVDTLIASGGAEASELPGLYRNQGAFAVRQNNPAKAEAAFTRLTEIDPADADAIVQLAKIIAESGRPAEATGLLVRAIAVKRSAGQAADESWYLYGLKTAYEAKLASQATNLAHDLFAAYPTKGNWRDGLLVYRVFGNPDAAGQLDFWRLMRASGALAGERDWYEYAAAADRAGLPGEAKAVLDEGIASHMIDPSKQALADELRTSSARVPADRASLPGAADSAKAAATGAPALKIGDAYYGYGDYAKAAEFYRAALSKGGVDIATARLRLGVALAQGGKRDEAAKTFRTITGTNAELAAYWLAWLSRQAPGLN